MEKYLWYEIVDSEESFLQGDFINSCPLVLAPAAIDSAKVSAEVMEYDVVIMSQSCDLEQRKIALVLVCSVWPLSKFEEKNSFFESRRGKEALRQGNVLGYHLLNKCETNGFKTGYLVVDFRSVYSVPFDFLLNLATKKGRRLRLLPPYREHLSQAFARFFMRVGLPVDIPSFN